MKKRFLIAVTLLILFTTITPKTKLEISKFKIKKINIENNFLLKEKNIKKLLAPIYGKNIIFLDNYEIKTILLQDSFIESFNIKKRYPNTIKIEIFEKKPIAILINKNGKFYLSDKIDLIRYKKIANYENLPYILGNKKEFKIFYNNLKKNNFPLNIIKKYVLFESNRWNIETVNKKTIKLPSKNYNKSLENYLDIKEKYIFKK